MSRRGVVMWCCRPTPMQEQCYEQCAQCPCEPEKQGAEHRDVAEELSGIRAAAGFDDYATGLFDLDAYGDDDEQDEQAGGDDHAFERFG